MKSNTNSFSGRRSHRTSVGDKTNVVKAIEEMAGCGMAVLDREADSFPLLYLLSGEIFIFGENSIIRVW
jgi:hypothetical protein